MTGEIIYAIQQEVLLLLQGGPGSVIKRDDFRSDNWPNYGMPLITIEEVPGGDFCEMIGGRTRADWQINLSAYNVSPDVTGMDPTNYSATRINVIDELRQWFKTYKVWRSQEMLDVVSTYGMKWTLSAVQQAEPLEHPNGVADGKKIVFDTLSWDESTDGTKEVKPLNAINQLNPPPSH